MTTLIAPIFGIINNQLSNSNRSKSKIGELFLDASYSEIIDFASEITDHSVENGSSVSDHVYVKPTKIKLTGSILDTSTDIISTIENTVNILRSDNIIKSIYGKSSKQLAAYEFLKNTFYNKVPVTVVIYYDVFKDMLIENMSFPKNSGTADQLYFELTLKQVSFAQVSFVKIARTKNIQDLVQKKIVLGRQETKEASEQIKKSAAASAIDYFLNNES